MTKFWARCRLSALSFSVVWLAACPVEPQQPQATGPVPDTVCPKGMPAECKVLRDDFDEKKLVAKYHVLVAKGTKHDDADAQLKALYRHLMMRRDVSPTQLGAYLYTDQAQFSTPPESPVGSVVQNPGDKSPTFDNKIPLELWQQVERAIKLSGRADRKLKRKLEYTAEPDKGLVTIVIPFTAGQSEDWAEQVDYSQVAAYFSEFSQQLFNNIADLKMFLFRARWKDQEVAFIELSRADYDRINLAQVEQRIGQMAGRTFLELTMGKGGSEATVEKAHNRRRATEYKKAIDQIKGKVFVSPLLK